jgi:hypothetical protein
MNAWAKADVEAEAEIRVNRNERTLNSPFFLLNNTFDENGILSFKSLV